MNFNQQFFRYLVCITFLFTFPCFSNAQNLIQLKSELQKVKQKQDSLLVLIEKAQLNEIILNLKKVGYPKSTQSLDIAEHSAMVLGFNCEKKLAAWSFHILTPDVAFGKISRSNDFRNDSLIDCQTAIESDYFITQKLPDGTSKFDGFGFDRGHLAPSADFRWSAKALSESYFYSNMTPQVPEFNRESWAELESLMRRIADQDPKDYYIVTGPILEDSLKFIEKSIHQIPIPRRHYKIIADLTENQPKGMAFLMPNELCKNPLSSYVVSIDSIEKITGLDFFPNLSADLQVKIETKSNFENWKTQKSNGDVEPFPALSLKKGQFNTDQATSKVGQKVSIVGKVVIAKYIAKSNATFLNLDKQFPNQNFTICIWKDGMRNFSYQPIELEGETIVVTGIVQLDKNGIPSITVEWEKQIEVLE
jgi:endonuclease G, mitochondrial